MKKSFYGLFAILFFCSSRTFCQDISFRKITADNGLSHNTVYTIVQDEKGFMWFGTREGLNRYDSYAVKNYYIKNDRPGISANRISTLLAVKNLIYIGTDNGFYVYDSGFDKITEPAGANLHAAVLCLTEHDGSIYTGTSSGFYKINKDGSSNILAASEKTVTAAVGISHSSFLLAVRNQLQIINLNGAVLKMFTEKDLEVLKKNDFTVLQIYHEPGSDWLCTNHGLLYLDEKSQKLTRIVFTAEETTESNTIRAVTRSHNGHLIIGTEDGMYDYDPSAHRSTNYQQSFDNNPNKLNDKAVYSAFTARDGSIWLGTYFGGINYIPSVGYGFKSIRAGEGPGQLNGKAISQMLEDEKHNIWIGTEDGGISIFNPKNHSFGSINRHSVPFYLDINNVHAIYNDRAGSIWVGTFLGGLHRFDLSSHKTTIYSNRPGDATSLSNDQVYTVYRDRTGVLWVGTQHGLNIFDYHTGKFTLFKPEIFGNEFIYDITEDNNGDLWFCCIRWNGLLRYQRNKDKVIHYISAAKSGSLPSSQVISAYKDSFGKLWFGTLNGGACLYNPASDDFKTLDTQNGLPNNNVYGILEDARHDMWFSTNRGLACYSRATGKFTNYDSRYGLPGNQFNFKSSLKAADSTLYFGTIHGLCYFNPTDLKPTNQQVPISFTGFQLFNKTVTPGDSTVLPRQIDDVGEINLAYAQNVFSISYAALNYSNVRGNSYAYYLAGFEKKWNYVNDKNTVTYTSLSPGKYVFHVKALNVSGKAISRERILIINVAPPFYLSVPAFILYFLLLCLAAWLYTRFVKFLHLKKLEVQVERMEKEKTAALTQHRLNFFTFISHEFKTPLTLIIASVEKFMEDHESEVKKNTELSVIKNNAARLFKMIQQLMEFRTIETDHLDVKLSRADIVKFIDDTSASFKTLAQNKGVTLCFTPAADNYLCYFDTDKLEKIVFNILSNAVKNTAQGTVAIYLNFEPQEDKETNVVITITDTGSGMSQTEVARIFETFYKGIDHTEGSGVGMALVKSLVTYLNGEISIDSEIGRGTSIQVKIPVIQTPAYTAESDEADDHQMDIPEKLYRDPEPNIQPGSFSHTLLIVEDNKELLTFLTKHFARYYNIAAAPNGQSGLSKLMKSPPDLVISDIKMPRMDGIELCQKIKSDARYRHIPVILLSDNARENVKIDGLDVGADAYLPKPFNLKEMELQVSNMIRSRAVLREQLLDMSKFGLEKAPRNNKDQEFLANLGIVLETNFSNLQFTVEEMAAKLHISRTLLHINLKKILDKSASELLNKYRLKKAVLMLKRNLPINEVAYYCGYNDPNYFSRIFKKYYNISPGAFRADPDKYREIIQ